MKMITRRVTLFFGFMFFCLIWGVLPAPACTTFCLESQGSSIFGRNYDWDTDDCLIIVNKRGVIKRALLGNNRAKWVSQYASITFNQFGREFPLGGMNEMGLVIECMWLQETQYPDSDSRQDLPELQWVQYQLDTASTVAEVIANDKKIRITSDSAPLHFLVSDLKGGVVVLEFIEGKMRSYINNTLPYAALANTTYERSLAVMKKLPALATIEYVKKLPDSHNRFALAGLAAIQWKKSNQKDPIEFAFKTLETVSRDRTMFSIVYDSQNKRIYYRTKKNPEIRNINFTAFDLSCQTPVKILDIQFKTSNKNGDVSTDFTNYSKWANYRLIKRSFAESLLLNKKSESQLNILAKYPESLNCQK